MKGETGARLNAVMRGRIFGAGEVEVIEGFSRGTFLGGLGGGIESSPQKGPPLPLFGGQKERLGEMQGSV